MTEGYAPVNGLKMYYRTHGAGYPLVLLHGGLLTAELSFGELIPQLAERHRVIAVELQGHGRTADTDREASVPNFADDVVGLLDHMGIQRADIYGFSLGGLTAMQLALTYPERVRRLVAASIQFRPDGFHEEIRNPDLWATSRRMPTADDFAAMRADYRRVAPDPDHFDAFQEKISAAVGAFPGWPAGRLRELAVPTLVMVGDNDFVPVEHAAEMFQLIPDARLAVLPGCTHMDLTRRPDLVLPAVRAFLSPPEAG